MSTLFLNCTMVNEVVTIYRSVLKRLWRMEGFLRSGSAAYIQNMPT